MAPDEDTVTDTAWVWSKMHQMGRYSCSCRVNRQFDIRKRQTQNDSLASL